MKSEVKDKIVDFIRKNTSKKYALEAWKNRTHPYWNMVDVWQCVYDATNGNQREMLNIIEQLTKKTKVRGRTQVYADVQTNGVDMVRDENGVLKLVGYYPQSTPEPKGQKTERNPNIFKKTDGQVKKRYQETEATLMNAGAILRRVFPNASNDFLTQALKSVKLYAEKHKKSPMLIASRIALHRLVFDSGFNLVAPPKKNVGECVTGKIIMITEEMASFLKEKAEMTEYKFYSNVKHFINDLLVDPVNATTPFLLKINGLTRGKLLHYLIKNGALQKTQHINDKDENGNPKTATMMVKYKRAPEKILDRKLNRLWIKLFERNVPEYKNVISEDGEGGDCGGGCEIMGTTSAESSGQYSQPLFPMQRRTVKEDTTTSSVGNYQYDVPFAGDEETLSRNNGVGGSTSINHIDENWMFESNYYDDYLGDYNTYNDLLIEAMSIKDIKEKWYPDVDDNVFRQILQADPTYRSQNPDKIGKFAKWLLSLYKNGSLKLEDLYKATQYLSTFVKYYNRIEVKDINKYRSLNDLYKTVEPFIDSNATTSKSDEVRRAKEGAEKVYEDNQWLIIVPHTEEASCYYGKGTQWCTAADESNNMFDEYDRQGNLYINIDKKNKRKYQFHFESDSFMNEEDDSLLGYGEDERTLADTIGLSQGACEFYAKIGNPVCYTDKDRESVLADSYVDFDEYEYNEMDEAEQNEYLRDVAERWEEELREISSHDADVEILTPHFVLVTVLGRTTLVDVYGNNKTNGKWFDSIGFPYCNYCVVTLNGSYNYMHVGGQRFLFNWGELDGATQFDTKAHVAAILKNKKMTLIDEYGDQVLNEWWDFVDWRTEDGWHKVRNNGKFNMVSLDGHYLLKNWANSLGFFGNARNPVNGQPLCYVTFGVKGNGKMYVDLEGNFYDYNRKRIE